MENYNFIVYLLENNINHRTHLGITDNLHKTLLLYNKGQCSYYTKKYKNNGEWNYYVTVSNLQKYEALNIERSVNTKQVGSKKLSTIQKRLNALLIPITDYPHCKITYYN